MPISSSAEDQGQWPSDIESTIEHWTLEKAINEVFRQFQVVPASIWPKVPPLCKNLSGLEELTAVFSPAIAPTGK